MSADASSASAAASTAASATAASATAATDTSSIAISLSSSSSPPADLEQTILSLLSTDPHAAIEDTLPLSHRLQCAHQSLVGAVKSLEADGYVCTAPLSRREWELTSEGDAVADGGSAEIRVLSAVSADGSDAAAITAAVGADAFRVGFAQCVRNKWLQMDKATGRVLRAAAADSARDTVREQLRALRDAGGALSALPESSPDAVTLRKRQLIALMTRKSFSVTRGPSYGPTRRRRAADVTHAMLADGSWRDADFKAKNLSARGRELTPGYLHPLMRVRAEFRRILLDMGFEEMPTARFVESSFWNFDALFQPQSHPARDLHDTFFIRDPPAALELPDDYVARVAEVHSRGGYGSLGYGYDWKLAEATKNLLRTHTTAVSARLLYRMGQEFKTTGAFTPRKYFSIDRVFRNEALDATHLAEFHQVEFLVADRDLSLGHLRDLLRTFFAKIGITKLRFKPAYNPYTEPSMEVFGFHPDLNRWTEIGNSGIFRPEMLLPMGLPADVQVIAGGLSLERPTMIKYSCKNIRDLFGHSVDLHTNASAPIPRF